MAILSSPEKKMILSDIYSWILENYHYFKTRPQGWKNSIRHNLSLNACFHKNGRSATGKGHYWSIHPANVRDFERGDFRRRKAQHKVHRAMGIVVPDGSDPEEDEEEEEIDVGSPCSSLNDEKLGVAQRGTLSPTAVKASPSPVAAAPTGETTTVRREEKPSTKTGNQEQPLPQTRKRTAFDMASLLAPDEVAEPEVKKVNSRHFFF